MTTAASLVISVLVPIRARSLNDQESHWAARAKRVKMQRNDCHWALSAYKPAMPCVVTLTRIAPSAGLDDDNNVGSMKAARDGVADWLGVPDNDPRVQWKYDQGRGKEYGVRITVESEA